MVQLSVETSTGHRLVIFKYVFDNPFCRKWNPIPNSPLWAGLSDSLLANRVMEMMFCDFGVLKKVYLLPVPSLHLSLSPTPTNPLPPPPPLPFWEGQTPYLEDMQAVLRQARERNWDCCCCQPCEQPYSLAPVKAQLTSCLQPPQRLQAQIPQSCQP